MSFGEGNLRTAVAELQAELRALRAEREARETPKPPEWIAGHSAFACPHCGERLACLGLTTTVDAEMRVERGLAVKASYCPFCGGRIGR